MRYESQYHMTAYNAGYAAAKSGCHKNNCFPYISGPEYYAWLDGYEDYEANKR